MSEERETEFVTGTIGAIIQKAADKWQVAITPPGSQYPKNCWTKSQDIVNAATALIGQQATFECGVSHWTNNEGAPVKSLWVNAINPGASPAPQAPAQAVPASQDVGDPRQASIERQTALKAAVEFHAAEPLTSAGDVCVTAERFVMFLQGREENVPETPKPNIPPTDDDIPF